MWLGAMAPKCDHCLDGLTLPGSVAGKPKRGASRTHFCTPFFLMYEFRRTHSSIWKWFLCCLLAPAFFILTLSTYSAFSAVLLCLYVQNFLHSIRTGIFTHRKTSDPAATQLSGESCTRCHTVRPGRSKERIFPPCLNYDPT